MWGRRSCPGGTFFSGVMRCPSHGRFEKLYFQCSKSTLFILEIYNPSPLSGTTEITPGENLLTLTLLKMYYNLKESGKHLGWYHEQTENKIEESRIKLEYKSHLQKICLKNKKSNHPQPFVSRIVNKNNLPPA